MPTGIIINSLAIIFGGIFGGKFGYLLSENIKNKMNLIFALCAMAMGVSAIGFMKYMPAVIFAVVIGSIIGIVFNLGDLIKKGAIILQKGIAKILKLENSSIDEEVFLTQVVTIIVLFCVSGTGIYGSLDSGMTGDNSILIAKSILDFFTAAIFACNLGYIVSGIAIPQFIIFYILFLLAKFIVPLTNLDMINDFKACGGFIMLATGLRIANIKIFPTAEMIPAMIFVMPISWFWGEFILKLL